MECTLAGEESFNLVTTPKLSSNVGQILTYGCSQCGRKTIVAVRDAGLLPLIFGCRARGQKPCKGGALLERRDPVVKGSPMPTWEFYRPRGTEYAALKDDVRGLIDLGILDDRPFQRRLVTAR